MPSLHEQLQNDVRFQEGLIACINCGTCTAVCPAAEFYDYDPRRIVDLVQKKDDTEIERLLKSETIWYCGECMSCVTRCPRNNAPGLVIMALRGLSQDLGYFVESEKGRQQIALKRSVGESILKTGYCIYIRNLSYAMHPESGPIWDWKQKHLDDIYQRLGGNLDGRGCGPLRKIPQESLDELQRIFDVSGGTARYETIERFSQEKATQMGLSLDEYIEQAYNGKR